MYLDSSNYPKSIFQFLNELESEMGCSFLDVDKLVYRKVLIKFSNVIRSKIIESADAPFIRSLAISEQECELNVLSFLFPDLYLILKNDLGATHVERLATLFVEYLEGIAEDCRRRAEDLF